MKPIDEATGKIHTARPYVPVGAVFGAGEIATARLCYREGRHPPEL